jgi:2'-5' RNA ligase
MPAHITVLFPFLLQDRIGEPEIGELQQLFAQCPAFAVEFRELAAFPGVLYLAPSPAEPLVALTRAVERRWPDHPPFEGAFDDVVPHLTVAQGASDETVASIREEIGSRLPLGATLSEARLYAFAQGRWSVVDSFPLGAGSQVT